MILNFIFPGLQTKTPTHPPVASGAKPDFPWFF